MEINKEVLDFREKTRDSDNLRDSGLKEPECLNIYSDISYGEDENWNVLDIYSPKDIEGPQPVIVNVHGGGWVYGTKETYRWYGMDLARRGFAVVNFSYRLALENPFPAALEDINRVFQWMKKNAMCYNLDLDRVFVVGDSAGAQLGAQYCAMLSNPEFAELYDFAVPCDMKIRAAAFNCGVYDLKAYSGAGDDGFLTVYLGENMRNNMDKCDTIKYLNDKFPPSYIMTSEYDFLREYSYPMYIALLKTGVEAEYHKFGKENDVEMTHVFHLNLRLRQAGVCNDDECRFFKKFL